MCGIVGYLDKRAAADRPAGQTLLAMLQALSCRGPDSAGVAVFALPRPFWVLQVKLPDDLEPAEATREIIVALQACAAVIRHHTVGSYLRLEIECSADAASLEERLLERVAGAEVVSLGHQLEIVKQVGSPDQLERAYHIGQWPGSHGIGHT